MFVRAGSHLLGLECPACTPEKTFTMSSYDEPNKGSKLGTLDRRSGRDACDPEGGLCILAFEPGASEAYFLEGPGSELELAGHGWKHSARIV